MPPSPLRRFHPHVRAWFTGTLGEPSDPQRFGWPAIASGDHTLLLAPTGTGKTLAAFLWELNALIVDGASAPLANAVHLLYVSPLKALNNDIQRNLEQPLAALRTRFAEAGDPFPEIRIAVRTGDTPASARARMLRKAPHVLITTPESLHILLTSLRVQGMFTALRAVILDEIHAVAGTKRGAHLALTLERLERVCEHAPQRIGLSATQRPLDEVARFLGGMQPPGESAADAIPRPVTVVDCGSVKRMALAVESPVADLGDVGGSVWPSVAPLVLRHIREARTTLVFVNNRAQAERMAARINALAEEEVALPYHGSLSRERRLLLEERLKAGELRALVSTSSLELGIDIGSVDVVVQLQSPKRVSAGLQRVGRAGHNLRAISRGVFVPTFRDDAMEILAVVRAMEEGDVEPTRVVQNALDVLAQVIVAAVSVDDWDTDALYDLVRRSYPYHALGRAAYDEVLAMLSGKYPADLAAELEPRITWDRSTGRLSGSRAARMTAVISGGTIPDRGLYAVVLGDRTRLGELDEEFVHESRVGDAFQLGSSTWRIAAIEHDRVVVTPAPGAPARMPFWHGEYMARAANLSRRVGALRRELAEAGTDEGALLNIAERHHADHATTSSLASYVAEQRAATAVVPDDRTLVLEHFRDETGAVRLVLHSAFGGRVNAPWGMALAQRAREVLGLPSGGAVDVQVLTTDDGIMLRLPDIGGAPPAEAVLGLGRTEAERRVLEEVGSSSLFGARFRMNASRALLLPRGSPRRRMPLWLQRLKALDLLQTVRAFPSFPILVETYRDVLQDAFDLPALGEVLDALQEGRIGIRIVGTERPSPFAASLQFGFVMDWMYGDDTPRAEQRAAALSLDRALLDDVMRTEGADEDTRREIDLVVAERRGTADPVRMADGSVRRSWRARTADELAMLIDRAGDVTIDELHARVAGVEEGGRGDIAGQLFASERVIAIELPTRRIILTESYGRYLAAYGAEMLATVGLGAGLEPRPVTDVVADALRVPSLTPSAARREILARFLSVSGPTSTDEIAARYGWPARWIERRLAEWEGAGKLVRGRFRPEVTTAEWASRRVVEQARRRALAALRREIEAVELPVFAAFLQRWQHVDPRDRLGGADAVSEVLAQLAGIPRPAEAWERDYLPARVSPRYDPAALGALAAVGRVVWAGSGRFDDRSGARTLTAIRFFARGSGGLWIDSPAESQSASVTSDPGDAAGEPIPLGETAIVVRDTLARLGASFFEDVQAETGLGTFALREGLRELAAAGIVTNDTIDALRELLHWRPLIPGARGPAPDPTRWLPAGFAPSPDRPVVQRRANMRRIPKWRPDRADALKPWAGRWVLLHTPGILGRSESEEDRASAVARQWLDRYGVVTRDWWRRERPNVGWRAVYRELRRMEMRGDVRRGYFVRGLAGAQFARPDAVERLREVARDVAPPVVVMAASDPANPYTLPLEQTGRATATRPRGPGALLVTRGGRVLLSAEGGVRRVMVATELSPDEVRAAAAALGAYLSARPVNEGRRRREPLIEAIDGDRALSSAHARAFTDAGFRLAAKGLIWRAGGGPGS